jgi:hypothetical protein
MRKSSTMRGSTSRAHGFVMAAVIVAVLATNASQAEAQGRDGVLNGGLIGAAVGAGTGVAFTHAVRDSDLTFTQYARGALVFGAIGAGVGVGVDALLNRAATSAGIPPRRLSIAPTVWRDIAGLALQWRW